MDNEMKRSSHAIRVAIIGGIVVLAIMALGMLWMGRSAQKDTVEAVRTISLLYLDELADRRAQVVENNLTDSVDTIYTAIDLLTEEDLSSEDNLRAYQMKMRSLFNLERFAFVDTNGLIHTATGIEEDIDQYDFDYKTIAGPEISIKNISGNKKVVIAVPVDNMVVEGNEMVVCFMEIDMDVMLQGVSLKTQDSEATFCNIYTNDGVALTDTVLGGLAVEDNLLEALGHAEYESGYSYEGVIDDFSEGSEGIVSFTYDGIRETLCYVPIQGTDWMLTYLVRDSVISERVAPVANGIIRKSVILSIFVILALGAIFTFGLSQMLKNAKLELERETADAANRAKQEELEQRLALQEQLIEQRAQQERQTKMITALSSDYRSVYYLELDKNQGICYQARTDIPGLSVGEEFDYLEAVTAYCNHYILEPYREEFLSFIRPDSIRHGLAENQVISYRYIISIDGKESYEAVRFARVLHHEESESPVVNNVGACFADVDAETRNSLSQQKTLSEALDMAEQASKAKTAFLSNMSHEIRTPMNAIIGLNNIALNEPDVPEKTQEYLVKIGASAQHLLGIINDILDVSRIESGKMTIKNEEFSFAKNLEQVNTIVSGQCADKGLNYECRMIGKIDDYYIGDGVKLKQVIINILGNAVKFTPSGGSVTFLVKEGRRYDGKATLEFTIKDTGVGMSKEYLPHLFDAFSQEDSSATSKYGSTGLGMPITKSIVELMNGHIEVESEKGVGTTFVVTVTLGESSRKDGLGDEDDLSPQELNVLVIDDDPIALEHAQIVLGQVGISCEVAGSGAEALELVKLRHARRANYDILLVDWKMPEMDGVELTRQVRSVVGHDTPIIILTSYNWDDVADEAVEAGVDTFVPKPLFAGSVLEEFKEAFRKKNEFLATRRADLKGRLVLLAEDMPVNAEIMIMVLSMRDIEVDLAENGRIAVEKFTGQPAGTYDAILMDMRMPEMDGLEATKTIRACGSEDARTIPIIALTANAFDEDVQRSMQAGLNAHLSKPVEPEALFETLETLIAQSE